MVGAKCLRHARCCVQYYVICCLNRVENPLPCATPEQESTPLCCYESQGASTVELMWARCGDFLLRVLPQEKVKDVVSGHTLARIATSFILDLTRYCSFIQPVYCVC